MRAISRRHFVGQTGAAVAGAASLLSNSSPLHAFPLDLPLGFQSYDVNAAMSKDLDGTFRALAGYGYQCIDFVWFGGNMPPALVAMTGKDLRRSFDSAGLKCQNCHFSWAALHDDYDKTMENAHALGLKSAVCQSAPGRNKTADDWKWQADQLNELGLKAKRDGILIGYHNHVVEFADVGGVIPFDVFLKVTDPKLVKMQLDVGSAAVAGKDPVAYLTQHPDHYFSIHAKDVRDGKIGIAVGEGTLDWQKIFAAAKGANLQNYVVETGARPDVVMEKLRLSVVHLRELKA